jgi:hypothetical protein
MMMNEQKAANVKKLLIQLKNKPCLLVFLGIPIQTAIFTDFIFMCHTKLPLCSEYRGDETRIITIGSIKINS